MINDFLDKEIYQIKTYDLDPQGKKITNAANQFVSVGVAKGKAKDSVPANQLSNFVDGMSGATITSKGLEKYMKLELAGYEPLSRRLRGQ